MKTFIDIHQKNESTKSTLLQLNSRVIQTPYVQHNKHPDSHRAIFLFVNQLQLNSGSDLFLLILNKTKAYTFNPIENPRKQQMISTNTHNLVVVGQGIFTKGFAINHYIPDCQQPLQLNSQFVFQFIELLITSIPSGLSLL